MFSIIYTVLAEDDSLQGLHEAPLVGEVSQAHLSQEVLREVKSCHSSQRRNDLQHCLITQLVPDEFDCAHPCPSQELADLKDGRVSQLSVGQVQSLERVIVEGLEDLLKFFREFDGFQLLLGRPFYLLNNRLLKVDRLSQSLAEFIANLHFGLGLQTGPSLKSRLK